MLCPQLNLFKVKSSPVYTNSPFTFKKNQVNIIFNNLVI